MLDVRYSRPGPGRARAAFTLVELLVVMGIVALFAGVIGFALRGGGSSTVGLQASQSIVVGLLTQARSQAVLTGEKCAVFVNADQANAERYLRYLVPAAWNESTSAWTPLDDGVFLPRDCFVVMNASAPTGFSGLTSSALVSVTGTHPLNSSSPDLWLGIAFTSRGTTATPNPTGTPPSGRIVVANGRYAPTFSLVDPSSVRGVSVTVFGQTRLLSDEDAF